MNKDETSGIWPHEWSKESQRLLEARDKIPTDTDGTWYSTFLHCLVVTVLVCCKM